MTLLRRARRAGRARCVMRNPLIHFAVLFGIAPLVLGGCTQVNGGNLQKQVEANEQAIRQLNSQLSGVQPAQADTWSQVQALRQEVASLRGDMDTLLYSLQALGGAQNMAVTLTRHEQALRLIESQLAMDLRLDAPVNLPAPPSAPVANMGGAQTAPVQPGAAVDPAAGGVVAGETQVVSPTPSTPAESTSVQPGNANTAQALYDSGLAAFNARKYEQSLNAFKDFSAVYPQHNLVANAWFWQGESCYQLKKYAEAALAYEKVISEFPNSSKAPDAYFKQGMCFVNLDKKAAAKERLNQLIKKYHKAPQARRAEQIIKEKKL